jgi:hypothetical protein
MQKFKSVTGNNPVVSDFRSKEEHDLYISSNAIGVIDFFWFLLGLITNSWSVFLGLLVMQFIFKSILNVLNFEPFQKSLGILFQILKVFIILALILNHFHFHLNWIDLL